MPFDAPALTLPGEAGEFPAAFDPVAFFSAPTVGHATVRSPSGRLLKRCRIETTGAEAPAHDALHFDELYVFDDGPCDRMHWAVQRSAGGFEAREVSVVGPVRTALNGPDWRVRFRRRANPPASGPVLLYDARFTLVTEDLLLKTVHLSLLGLPVATLAGHHRRV